jgi:hypothetical protein
MIVEIQGKGGKDGDMKKYKTKGTSLHWCSV